MTGLLRLVSVALVAALAALLLRRDQPALAGLLGSVGLLLLVGPVIARLREAVSPMKDLLSGTGFDRYGGVMLKALGVGITVRLAGDTCRDAGEERLAGGLELAGRLEILLLCLPLVEELLRMIREVMG